MKIIKRSWWSLQTEANVRLIWKDEADLGGGGQESWDSSKACSYADYAEYTEYAEYAEFAKDAEYAECAKYTEYAKYAEYVEYAE